MDFQIALESAGILLVFGYLVLTVIGYSTVLDIHAFITGTLGRPDEIPITSKHILKGILYTAITAWAIGLVAVRSGGRTKLTVSRAEGLMASGDLSADEHKRLREACRDLEETSRFTG